MIELTDKTDITKISWARWDYAVSLGRDAYDANVKRDEFNHDWSEPFVKAWRWGWNNRDMEVTANAL